MFRDVSECSRNVPARSGMFRVPGFIDALFQGLHGLDLKLEVRCR